MSPRRLLLALGALAALSLGTRPASAEDPAEAAARKRKVEEAKRAAAAAEKAFVERVNRAIDRGAGWLAAQQAEGGYWPSKEESFEADPGRLGVQALCLLTLVKCGATESDPAVAKGLVAWRSRYQNNLSKSTLRTYDAGVSLMLLDALHNPPDPPAQDGRYAPSKKKKCKYPKDAEEMARTLVAFLVDRRNPDALGWRYPNAAEEGPVDLSATQYAVLGLYAASRCGFEAPGSLWDAVADYCLKHQAAEGPEVERWIENPAWQPGVEDRYGPFLVGGKDRARGWAYVPGLEVWTGSMTSAGVAVLAIAKDRLRAKGRLDAERTKAIDRAMTDGIAWLSSHFAVDKNPGQGPGWHLYYLYGLERAGAMTGLVRFGKHDWYREGAEHLLTLQGEDGGWAAGSSDLVSQHETRIVQTCFALLFLRRATVPPAQPVGPVLTGR